MAKRQKRHRSKPATETKKEPVVEAKKVNSTRVLVLSSILIVAIFSVIMYVSIRYISGLTPQRTITADVINESEIKEQLKDINIETKDLTTLPNYSQLIDLGKYKGLFYELGFFDGSTYASENEQIVDNLLNQICSTTIVKGYARSEYETCYNMLDDNITKAAEESQIDKKEFIKTYYGIEADEDYEKYLIRTTINYLQTRMVIMEIARKEEITITNDDIETTKTTIKNAYSLDDENFNKLYTDRDIQYFAVRDKVYQWLLDNSEIKRSNQTTQSPTTETTTEQTTNE